MLQIVARTPQVTAIVGRDDKYRVVPHVFGFERAHDLGQGLVERTQHGREVSAALVLNVSVSVNAVLGRLVEYDMRRLGS